MGTSIEEVAKSWLVDPGKRVDTEGTSFFKSPELLNG